jgi:outer membrane protein
LKSVIKKATATSIIVGMALSLPVAASAQQDLKVGFVSTERIFRDAAPAKAATAKLEQEFSKR